MDSIFTSNGDDNRVVCIQPGMALEDINGQIDKQKQIVAASERKWHQGWGEWVLFYALFLGCVITLGRYLSKHNYSIIWYLIGSVILLSIYLYMLSSFLNDRLG